MEQIERIAQLYPVIMRVMGRIRSLVHDGMDLTYNQYKMLLTIYDKGSCPLNLLARELGIAMSSASEMVERLVNLGIVYRAVDEDNRRQVIIYTTDRGEELIRELRHGIIENYRQLFARLPEGDQERLATAFETIADVLGKLE
ncbi:MULTISPECIES: MarR family winged helix-turn-helix transcriptional regulator [Geobacter]|uniref:Winged helix-turn-helix transcriptional regulator, MarR family n=1 Tax=Geobacter sulfurreducens (strain ATCC 51573 / DSM 12127 / PCA) TaxID=243231 RepID=Q74H79_GEOSL|nr:MarR family transcriptional regulator [Geobacter sulfurreducens]BET59881.1 MarR family transcriptional regulator [Geobacter sp. 60473]AAR33348.1 winged helix-turn-helix transcriptional regulator, MarR family [Geobacter sulfurreducens PCA]AJY69729.1 MarR family transcriptional regulator [Geobacter sulfurreducens]UAC04126.1 MarR family transcriptional regulator [Geobacter sulfurreducens]UTG92763.1 MarR family transcriptional regulator [Geobacter sulfurreducens]